MTSLRTRVTFVVAAVAAVAVLITGSIMIPLMRAAAVQEARDRLAAQVELLARAGAPAASEVPGSAQGAVFAVVVAPPGGVATGPAASYVNARVRTAWRAGQAFSGTIVHGQGGQALVETAATRTGEQIVGAYRLSHIENALSRATWRIVIALIAGLAVAVLAGWLLASWLARPLAGTARAAHRLAHGERSVPMPANGPTETREVAHALTVLDAALQASEGRQREFLLSVSHELRTPLSAIRGYGEALADGLIAPEGMGAVGATLVAESARLDLFVADLLALARLEADDFRLEPATVDVDAVVADAVAAWEGRATTGRVQIVAAATSPLVIRTDPRRVRQVLDGLIENALRASPEGGRVTVSARQDGTSDVLLEVADTGPGLAAGDLDIAFERGALHARYRDARPVGTGLGLSIAARLVARLHGTITARAGDEGGAVFAVRLPSAG